MFLEKFSKLNLPFYGVRCPKIEVDKKDRVEYSIPENANSLEILKSLCKNHLDYLI